MKKAAAVESWQRVVAGCRLTLQLTRWAAASSKSLLRSASPSTAAITGRRSPRSTVPLLRGAGEEAHSPAGGARGVGGVVVGGVKLNQHQDYDFKHICI